MRSEYMTPEEKLIENMRDAMAQAMKLIQTSHRATLYGRQEQAEEKTLEAFHILRKAKDPWD